VPYLLNQARMIARYFRLSVWPSDLVVNYGPVDVSLHVRDVLPQAIVLVTLVIASILALIRRIPLGFLGAWIFITLAPTSSVIPIATEVGAERRMYLPLIAIVAFVVIGVYSVDVLRRRVSRVAAMAALAVVTLALGLGTMVRNREYSSGLLLAESVLRRWPTDVAHGMVGAELMSLHRDDEALGELRLAARTDPRSRYNLGAELFNTKQFDEAIRELREEVPWARRLAGNAYAVQHDWPHAIAQLTLALSMAPTDVETRRLLVEALSSQGVAQVDGRNFDQAIATFRRAVSLDATRVDVRQNLAAALIDSGDAAAAEHEARQAVAIGPDADSYDLLGRALALQGKMGDAVLQLQRALELSPDDARIVEDLRRVLAVVKR
jgi:tetratricopeptide (TPR) repeat protein